MAQPRSSSSPNNASVGGGAGEGSSAYSVQDIGGESAQPDGRGAGQGDRLERASKELTVVTGQSIRSNKSIKTPKHANAETC